MKTFLLFVILLPISGLSQNKLSEIFPDGMYYDALNYSMIWKKGIGMYFASNWENNNLVLDYESPSSYARTYIDVRSVSWKFEYEMDEYWGSKKLSDTLYREPGLNGAPDSKDYYALIPHKGYIAAYNIEEDQIILNHVYCLDKIKAKTFSDSALVVNLLLEAEKRIKKEVEEAIEKQKIEVEEELSSRELPKAKFVDSKLEAELLKAIQSYGEKNGWKETFTSVIITSDWWYNKNQYSGRVIGRTIEIAAVATWPNGKCTYQLFDIRQDVTDNTGQSFGNLYRYGTGSQYQVKCDKIEK